MDDLKPITNGMHIVFCLNDTFTPGVMALLNSIRRYNSDFHFHILYNRIKPVNLERIEALSNQQKLDLRFYKVNKSVFTGLVTPGHLRMKTYFRLAIPDILPNEIEKVLYLDCDLLAMCDLKGLFEKCVDDHAIAIASSGNSGVMIMNLTYWRNVNLGRELIQYILDFPELCPLADNSAIVNLVLPSHAVFFSNEWNMGAVDADESSKIVHFVGKIKPWHYKYPNNIWKRLFFEHLDQTPMQGWRPNLFHDYNLTFRNVFYKLFVMLRK